ncbi:hypothetical protein QN401_28760, partial [Pseudomonas sp. 5S3]
CDVVVLYFINANACVLIFCLWVYSLGFSLLLGFLFLLGFFLVDYFGCLIFFILPFLFLGVVVVFTFLGGLGFAAF